MLAQVDLIRRAFAIRAGEIDLATFPPFALFDPGLGMTSVIPDMDPTRPASAEPEKLMAAIAQHGCTSLFGSPALLDTLSRYAERHAVRLGTVRRVLSAGAPVRPDIIARTYAMLPADAEVWTPYGATECLPVAIIEGREVLAVARERTAEGGGICVGRPLAENTVRIIRIDDAPIACWHDDLLCAPGEIGEITVRGPTVTTRYFGRDAATVLAKIDERGAIVHRMGDLGYVDDQGRLWFVGRKSQRVITACGTLYPEMIEGIFNAVPQVRRSALVGIGRAPTQWPVVCVELEERTNWQEVHARLCERAATFEPTRRIDRFLPHPGFPVDIRHNAKIGRERLAQWAAKQYPS
jgi:acyl-CoA synthetase (AMP-forming)/AMP-acid ligase II